MLARLLTESLRRGRRRKLVAAAAVALGTLAATALASVLVASGDRLAAELAGYGANLRVEPDPADGKRETFPVAELDRLRKIFWRNNLVAVAPLYPLRVRVSAGGGPARVATVLGSWYDHDLGTPQEPWRTGLPGTRPALEVDGKWPSDCCAEAVVGARLAGRLDVGRGDSVDLELSGRRTTLLVVGTVRSGGDEDEALLVPLPIAQELAGRPGETLAAEIFAVTTPEPSGPRRDPRTMDAEEYDRWYCTAYPSSVAFQIGEALPSANARLVPGVAAASAAVLRRLRGTLLLLALVVGAGAAIAVTAAMTATVLERRLEVGLLAALGAERRQVTGFLLLEASLLGLFAGLAGGGAGLATGRLVGQAVFDIAVPWMPILLIPATVLGVLLAVAGSAVPVVRALSRHPAFLLREVPA